MRQTYFLIILSIIFGIWNCSAINLHPVIGIYTQPSKFATYDGAQYSFVASSYVQFIESAGAQVVIIPYDADQATLDQIFSNINGILFPGGSTKLHMNAPQPGSRVPYNQFTYNAKYLYDQAILSNQKGSYFPIWGTCLGFELLHYLVNNLTYPMNPVTNQNTYVSRVLDYDFGTSRLFSSIPQNLVDYAASVPAVIYHHEQGIFDYVYSQYPLLPQFFKRTSHTYNGVNQTFVSSVQGHQFPFYGSQFHPEKNQFQWTIQPNREPEAIEFVQSIAQFFVNEARKSDHFASQEWIDQNVIYNYKTIIPDQIYSLIYIMPNFYHQNLTVSPSS